MSREQQGQQGQLDTVEEDAREQEAEHGLPPVVQARVMRLGPADDEALRVLLREWPAYTHAILQVAAHQMGNIAVIRALEAPKAGGAKPQAITGYKPPIAHENIHKFIDDPSDQPKVASPAAAATDAAAATGDATAATTKVLTVPGEPAWFAGARTYNLAHPELVEQFNAATDNKFVGADGTLDLQGIWSWQAHHGLVHDGKIGPHTNDAAKALKTKAEPKLEPPKPKIEEPKVEDPKPKLEDPKPRVEEHKPKLEDPKPRVEEHKPRVEDPKPKPQDPKPRLEEHKPKLEDPKPQDSIASLAAGLPSPTVTKVVTDLTKLSADEAKMTRVLQGEFKGNDREQIVAAIHTIRDDLTGIDKSGLDATKLGKFVTLVNRKLQELAPYMFQGFNILTIETRVTADPDSFYSTCNMTSLAMSLELLGKSAGGYSGERERILMAARTFRGDLTAKTRGAILHSGDLSASWDSLVGLRLPDFLELAAVAEDMAAPTAEEAMSAQAKAKADKIRAPTLGRLAARFGVGMTTKTINWDSNELSNDKIDDSLSDASQRRAVEKMEHLRDVADKSGKESDRKAYEAALARLQPAMHGKMKKKDVDTVLPVDRYRQAVLTQLRPILDSGAAVMVGAWQHWIRLYGLNDRHVFVQDPGSWYRHEQQVPWEEARAMGYFWTNLVFK